MGTKPHSSPIAPGEEHKAPDNGQGGLLDVAVHPDYAQNGWIYFTYSSPGDDDTVMGDDEHGTATALYRARLSEDGSELVNGETVYAQSPRVDHWAPLWFAYRTTIAKLQSL